MVEDEAADPIRLLVIADVERLAGRMDRNLFQSYETLARCSGVRLTGPGCAGFSRGMPVAELFGRSDRPDFIIHGPDHGATGRPLVTGLADLAIPKAMQIVDSWEAPPVRQRFLKDNRFDYAFHVTRPREPEYERACPAVRFIWTPNAVPTDLFRNYGLEKVNDVLFYGAVYDWYPLRKRLRALLEKLAGDLLRVKIISHPGYWDDGYTPQPHHCVGERLAREINSSWITIVTASIHGCLFVKHLEVPAAMSLPAGSVPDEARPLFGRGFLDLANTPDEAVATALREVLSDKDELLARISEAHDRVRTHCSMQRYAQNLLHLVSRLVRSGRRKDEAMADGTGDLASSRACLPGAFTCSE